MITEKNSRLTQWLTWVVPKQVAHFCGRVWSEVLDRRSKFYHLFYHHLVEVGAAGLWKTLGMPYGSPLLSVAITSTATRAALLSWNKYGIRPIKTSQLMKMAHIRGLWAVQLALVVAACRLWRGKWRKVAIAITMIVGALHCVSLIGKKSKAKIK